MDDEARSSIDDVMDAYRKDVDLTLLRENLRLTPHERVLRLMRLQRLAEEARRAGGTFRHRPRTRGDSVASVRR